MRALRCGKNDYRGLIGGLLYLSVYTRPDISYSVGVLSQFLANPGLVHWTAAKRILRYLRNSIGVGISYRRDNEGLVLAGASDADWAGNLDDRRSTSGYVFSVQREGGVTSWSSKRQPTVALSSTEAEYVALAAAGQEVLFLRSLLEEFGFAQILPTVISEDNQSCISMTKHSEHKRTKHIDIKFHFLRDLVRDGVISVHYVPTESMVADIMTKHISRFKTEKFRDDMSGL